MKIHITSEWLHEQDACASGVEAFNAEFPTGLEIDLDDRDQVVRLLRTSQYFRIYGRWLCERVGHDGMNLSGADLTLANLAWANFYRADLTLANLTWANFYRADLTEANLTKANFYRADLSGANLPRANLSGANLSGANLLRANLLRANLTSIDLTWANLTRTHIRRSDIVRSGQDPSIFAACVIEEDV